MVGILTFISKINTVSVNLKARKILYFSPFELLWAVEILCSPELLIFYGFFFYLPFVMTLCASVRERADLLALVCGV